MKRRPNLVTAQRVLNRLTEENRAELLESLIVALCVNAIDPASILSSYLDEAEFENIMLEATTELGGWK
ncbi:MAG: hypothetical protein ACYCX3_12315 [Thermoleophilia bacterium]